MDLFLVPANTKYLGDIIQYFSIQAKICMVGDEKYVFFSRPVDWMVTGSDIWYNSQSIGQIVVGLYPTIEFDADSLWDFDVISQVDPDDE